MDFVVEKATELGVATILPFTSSFTIPKFDENKIAKRVERWRNLAQRGKAMRPDPCAGNFAVVRVSSIGRRRRRKRAQVIILEKEIAQTLRQVHETNTEAPAILIAIGPEGGLSTAEAELAVARGFYTVHSGGAFCVLKPPRSLPCHWCNFFGAI